MILYSRNIAVENNIIRKSFAVDHQKKKKNCFAVVVEKILESPLYGVG